MNVAEAWTALGMDWSKIVSDLLSMSDLASRVHAAENLCSDARKIAKKFMAAHHPDKNPGDAFAAQRFRHVKDALETIEASTESLRASYEKMKIRAEQRAASDGFIVIK